MSFITFNTEKKAQHYINWLMYVKSARYYDDEHVTISIRKGIIIEYTTYDAYCSASDPANGYICCSGNIVTETRVIGKIKSS